MNHVITINLIKDIAVFLFKDNLTGVYLHGSAAFGCYNPAKSDVDLIIVTETSPSLEEKVRFIKAINSLNDFSQGKGIELSIVREKYCRNFVYPTPFELHFSVTHTQRIKDDPVTYCKTMNGTDKDLAAHFTVINHVGKCICGMPVKNVFGNVPRKDYIDSIMYDIENACEDILYNPVYVILNICRTACYLKYGKVLSKRDGGILAKKEIFTDYTDIISMALDAYNSDIEFDFDDDSILRSFAYIALEYIRVHTDND